jgi:imidazolonepropionase-like amidohydrolase
MKTKLLAAIICGAALSIPSAQSPSPQASKLKALVGGTLIDGYGGTPVRNSVILVEGERISAVGTVDTLPVPKNAEVISTEGMSVLPGLWDMHVHLMLNGHGDYAHWDKTYPAQLEPVIMPASARQLLLAGVTSARDLGAPLDASINVRTRIEKGQASGATMYVSGPFIQHEPYPGTELFRWGVSGAEDGRAKVRKLADAGVDVIKLIDQDQMTLEEMKAVVDEAHRRNLMVVAHAHRPEEIRRGLQAGVDNFEHTGLGTAPEYPEDLMRMIRERVANQAAGPLFWTPTIQVLLNYEYLRDNPEHIDAPEWREGLPKAITDDIAQSIARPERLDYYRAVPPRRPTLARKFQQLREAGVTMLIGTDSGVPMLFHSTSTWRELDAWVNTFGVDAMTAIRAATYWPAVAMRKEREVGTVSPGKYADIIAVRGDVLRYIALLQRVDLVVKRGARVK